MHRCLYITEVLSLIFGFVTYWDDEFQRGPQVNKKTLASLARTCHLLSSPALDVLWHDLDSFDPLLKIIPVATSFVDDTQWLTFRNYAKRVQTIHEREVRVLWRVRQEIISALQYCPEAYIPLLPNLTELEWIQQPCSAVEDSIVTLWRYFASPAVTTITLSPVRWPTNSPAELAVFEDLPRLFPNLTSFTLVLFFSWDYEPSLEVAGMVTRWPSLRTLQTCAITQPAMDQLFSQRTLESLGVEYNKSSPIYNGRIPDTVREFSLGVDSPPLCGRFFEAVHASPARFRLLVGMNEKQVETDIEEMFYILPRHLDTSRLLSLTIRPRSTILGIHMWHTLSLRGPLIPALVEFTALRELDLDYLCTAGISDADYARLAGLLPHLRSLKLGTADPSILRSWPAASVGAVIAVLTYCKYLETLHIVFDGSIPPPTPPGEVCQGRSVSNRCLTKLHVGHSPIRDATINAVASCFKSAMPCLVQIEHKDRNEGWRAVQNILQSY